MTLWRVLSLRSVLAKIRLRIVHDFVPRRLNRGHKVMRFLYYDRCIKMTSRNNRSLITGICAG